MKDSSNQAKGKNIFINKKKYDVTVDSLTGTEILALAGLTPDQYDLYLIHGHDQELIAPDKKVEIKNGMHFNAIPKVIPFGSK